MKRFYLFLISAVLISGTLMGMVGCGSQETVSLTISAAASLTDVIKEVNNLYIKEKTNVTLTPNFDSSGTLQKQIENGAPTDIFISAAAAQMDALQKGGLIVDNSRKNLLGNKVVLIVPASSTLGIKAFADLTGERVKKIAIGDPKSVPAGTYAQQAFDLEGITDKVKPKCVLGSNVRQVLTYVEGGDVDAGVVFSTDAKTSNKVKVIASAPDKVNANVMYPVAIIKSSKNQNAAMDYENFLFSDKVKVIFEKYGFNVIGK